MGQKVLFISSDGIPIEIDKTSDKIEALGYEVNAPSTDGITATAGVLPFDDVMGDSLENIMEVGAAVLFPVVTDDADELDALRIPAIAGVPSATPTDGGTGYLVWDSSNGDLYAWDGSAWDNLSTVNTAEKICNTYTADEALTENDVLYISAADNVSKADVSAGGAPSRVIGLAFASVADLASLLICSEGLKDGFSGLTPGARQFADPSTPGGITEVTPVGTGNSIVQIGYAKSATELQIHIEQLGRRT